MLAKRITTPTVFSGALALAALSGCSLQDYDALGAGNKTNDRTEDRDETTTDSESTSTPTSTTSESNEPDASVTNETDTSDTSETEQPSTESSSSSSTETSSTTEVVTTTSDIVDTTTDEGTSEAPPPPAIVTEGNLIENSSFESAVAVGTQPGRWQVIGSAAAISSTDSPHSGTRSWMTAGRTANWEGPGINLTGLLEPDQTYVAKAWVRADTASTFHIVRKIMCAFEGGIEVDNEENNPLIYQQLTAAFSIGTEWVQLETLPFTLASLRDCDHHLFVMYFEGPAAGSALYLDDVSIVAVDE